MNNSDRCIVTSSKRYMRIYEILYIVGLIGVFIGAISDYVLNTTPQYLLLSIIIGTALFASATILWAVDRKCEVVRRSSKSN